MRFFFGDPLWQQGSVSGAMALESSWKALAEDRRFSLLCAYPTTALGSAELGDVNQVCHLHVEDLAHRWGCDRLDAGKVLWVELEESQL